MIYFLRIFLFFLTFPSSYKLFYLCICLSRVCHTVSFLICFPLSGSDFKYNLPLLSRPTTVFVSTQTLLCSCILFIVSLIDIYVNLYYVLELVLSQIFNRIWNIVNFSRFPKHHHYTIFIIFSLIDVYDRLKNIFNKFI